MRYKKLIGDETRAFPDISNIFASKSGGTLELGALQLLEPQAVQ